MKSFQRKNMWTVRAPLVTQEQKKPAVQSIEQQCGNLLPSLLKKYATAGEAVKTVFNALKEQGELSNYKSIKEFEFDVAIRAMTIKYMSDVNNEGLALFRYARSTQTFAATSSLWQTRPLKISQIDECDPIDAIRELFLKGASLDCERAADACVLRAIAEVFSLNDLTQEFNDFYNDKGIELKRLGWNANSLCNFPLKYTNKTKLLPGDRAYIVNLSDYITYNSGALASGEHCIYMGNNKYQALKESLKSYDQFVDFLASSYDPNRTGFKNFLYEKFRCSDFVAWSQKMRNVSERQLNKYKMDCEADFQAYEEHIAPKRVTEKNLEQHMDDLCDFRRCLLSQRIKQANENVEQYSKVRRVDIASMLVMVEQHKERLASLRQWQQAW